ncbi:MAG: aminotransferase class III-fold pyridoxal phosphate-dependent enzyme, partial [Solirubrobacterales bacterium]
MSRAVSTSDAALTAARSSALGRDAAGLIPGAVNSPVRAMRAIGREPIFIEHGAGCELTDVDGNTYVDWVCSWGPLILGHANPDVVEAVHDAAGRGTSYGAPTEAEVELARELARRFASVE